MCEKEIWKPLTDYSGYEISSYGRMKGKSGIILKLSILKTGYYSVVISPDGRNGKQKCLKIHREVAKAFIPNPNNFPIINHKDGNKLNNHISNLEWCTAKYNIQHAYKNGLIKNHQGYCHNESSFTKEDIEYIRTHYKPRNKYFGCRALARKFNVYHTTVLRVINGTRYVNNK